MITGTIITTTIKVSIKPSLCLPVINTCKNNLGSSTYPKDEYPKSYDSSPLIHHENQGVIFQLTL